jgi:hypothetical protein
MKPSEDVEWMPELLIGSLTFADKTSVRPLPDSLRLDEGVLGTRFVPDLEGNNLGKNCCKGVRSIGKFAHITPRPASILVHMVETNDPAVASVPFAEEYRVVKREIDAAQTMTPRPKMQVKATFCRVGSLRLNITGGTIRTMMRSVTML